MAKFCTHCGAALLTRKGQRATQLYDEDLYSKSKILKLLECSSCGEVADKYVECDGAIVLIDLALQSKQAYRHVLLNGSYGRLILKMSLLSVICDGYVSWSSLQSSSSAEGELFFEQEYQFYVRCTRAAAELLTFLLAALASSSISSSFERGPLPLLLGLLMSYSFRFCNLAAFLWASPPPSSSSPEAGGLMWAFVYLMFFMATVRIMQVCRCLRLASSVSAASAAHLAYLIIANIDSILEVFHLHCLEQ